MFIKLRFKIRKFFRLLDYKINYGKRFKYKKINFRRSFFVQIEKGGRVNIARNCFFNNSCSINCLKNISIGENCIFGERVSIYDHNHVFNKAELIYKQSFKCKEVIIGNNCWIGSNVTILAGTVIGDNSVIGAGLVISGDIPSNSVVKRAKNSYIIEKIETKGE